MKSKIVLILVLGFVLFSCEKEYSLSLSVESVEFPLGGGEAEFTISSDLNWVLEVDDPWVSISQTYGKGDAVITIKAGGNDTGEDRTTELHLSSGTEMIRTMTITQKPIGLSLSVGEMVFDVKGTPQQLTVTANGQWEITIPEGAEWCVPDKTTGVDNGVVTFTPAPYTEDVLRSKKAIVFNISNLKTELVVSQQSDKVYLDGEVMEYQRFSATDVTVPVNLVILGDGFIDEDYMPGGAFDKEVDKAVDAFFSVEPYPTYKDYFSIYKVVAYSEERGATVEKNFVNESVRRQVKNTVFNSILEGGESTGINCDYETVFDYTRKIPGITEKDLPNTTIIVIINLDVRAGTAYMWNTGESIAMCPVGDSFSGIVFHEAGGHAFGKLYDEYTYYAASYPSPQAAKLEEYRQGDPWAFGANLSLTDDRNAVHWKHYFTQNGYEKVGLYEGADSYARGIWRPEEKSGMDKETLLYFNAPSREAIVRRIMTINGKGFNRDEFYAKDKTDYPATLSRSVADRAPLAPPVLMRKH
ncbi:M64 family metallopeptidase [Bacteroides sp. 51]|uniref:M64 family metallopeptidase n=1 Tax=Bacteroides sp. 51 TaxID=2302938 RepID=UPI0013D2AAF5|nr:M64 family metallopeptidase [Bacteroides sp. 51]NDV83852.1 hypothetical protein [Bacteroides sp. 51]